MSILPHKNACIDCQYYTTNSWHDHRCTLRKGTLLAYDKISNEPIIASVMSCELARSTSYCLHGKSFVKKEPFIEKITRPFHHALKFLQK